MVTVFTPAHRPVPPLPRWPAALWGVLAVLSAAVDISWVELPAAFGCGLVAAVYASRVEERLWW